MNPLLHLHHLMQHFIQHTQHERSILLSEKILLLHLLPFKPFTLQYFLQSEHNQNDPEIMSRALSSEGLLLELLAHRMSFVLNPIDLQRLSLRMERLWSSFIGHLISHQVFMRKLSKRPSKEMVYAMSWKRIHCLLLLTTKELLLLAVKSNGFALQLMDDHEPHVLKKFVHTHPEIVEEAIWEDPS